MKRYLFFLFSVVLAAWGGQRFAVAQSAVGSVEPKDSLAMVEIGGNSLFLLVHL